MPHAFSFPSVRLPSLPSDRRGDDSSGFVNDVSNAPVGRPQLFTQTGYTCGDEINVGKRDDA
jgi:hypothetical protein